MILMTSVESAANLVDGICMSLVKQFPCITHSPPRTVAEAVVVEEEEVVVSRLGDDDKGCR